MQSTSGMTMAVDWDTKRQIKQTKILEGSETNAGHERYLASVGDGVIECGKGARLPEGKHTPSLPTYRNISNLAQHLSANPKSFFDTCTEKARHPHISQPVLIFNK